MTDIITIVCAVNFIVALVNLGVAASAVRINRRQREIFEMLDEAMDAISSSRTRR